MQGCLDSWPVYHHHRPKRLFALHLTRLPARGKGTRLLAATGADVLCACSCTTRHAACHEVASMHTSSRGVQSWSPDRFPRPPRSGSPACRQSSAVTYRRPASERVARVEEPARRIGRQSISSSFRASLHLGAYLAPSPQAQPRSDDSCTIVAAGHLFSQCPASLQGPIPPAHDRISGTLAGE